MVVISRANEPFDFSLSAEPANYVPSGWTLWDGGWGPKLTVGTQVYVIFRDYHVRCGVASSFDWRHRNNEHDIIAYKEYFGG